jgi:hypothetical protein
MRHDARELAMRATFPIRDRNELAGLLAEEATLAVRGRVLPAQQALVRFPAYYFPIGSEADLASKLADLAAEIPGSEQDFVVEWVERTGERPGKSPADCWC